MKRAWTQERVLWMVSPQPGVLRWKVTRKGKVVRQLPFKSWAILYAAKCCNEALNEHGEFSELIIQNLDGTFSSDKRTFGKDPPGTKG